MSFDKEIGAPFTLASLPRPINTTGGRTQAAGVCSISGSKKRKRTEIAVGVDGEGILIYSLQNPQLVTSYALPPQTSFATAPYSLYRKGSSKNPSHRFTYACITQSASGEKPQLVCFAEKIQNDAATNTVKFLHTISNPADRVISIESIPISAGGSAKDGSHDVLVVFDNGQVTCLSSDLGILRWEANLRTYSPRGQPNGPELEYITLSTAKAVIHGLLRSREDVAVILDPTLEGKAEVLDLTQVLCVVSRHSTGLRTMSLFQLQTRSPDLSATHLPPLKHLLTWTLPSSTSLSISNTPTYSLHPTSGVLHQLVDGGIISYDFSGTMPNVSSELTVPSSSIDSFLHISSDLLFTISRDKCSILDVKFNSIQALLPLELKLSTSNDSKKRKHAEADLVKQSVTMPNLVAYFADIGLAVGILDQEVIGIQLGGSLARKRQKKSGTLLINSIGKGIPSESAASKPTGNFINSTPLKDSLQWKDWQKRVTKLDKYASKGKVAKFEELFAADLGFQLATPDADNDSSSRMDLENGVERSLLMNGVGSKLDVVETQGDSPETHLRKWDFPTVISDAQRCRHRHQATYALSRIFSWAAKKSSSAQDSHHALKVEFFPPNIFQWLLLSGYMTKESIRRSVLEQEPNTLETVTSIADGDIVKAIVEFDPELHILSAILNHGHFLPVGEVVQAIKILIQSLDDHPESETLPKLLTNGTEPSEDEMDVDLASELEAANHDLDHALSILDNGLFTRSHTLRPALIRLHTFPAPAVSSALRSMLPRRELESLVRLLHLELKNGGWTSQYDFADSETSPVEAASEDPDDHAVAIIASLLSCTLDAIGAGAWLASVGGSKSDESTEETIKDLYEDTSEALNGFWEARYMRGLLSEFLRYAANISKSQKPTNKSLENKGKPFAVNVATDEVLPMLPLGGKVDLGIEKTKAGKGGKKEERSAREIGMLISKRVPKYSFERIVI
ncbi:hypothetical protein K505DRAFT_304298 [Melanomma pulvis-pyrius CBS 109.77]|uniref:Utp8 beta-propeller domain-containing protein n=1 Tax=Melanomma pulvis-pyrius CBS 109.77 TaxID=1314802 RepID=A0A6A6XCX8_9PLEO|nr:hypothetical protein K505DRAFT_304298 [Melanomma pulvis-pyrius CBS 109.77]